MKRILFVLIGVFQAVMVIPQQKVGSPFENLPSNIEILTGFGERADISPDNKEVAFIGKTYGDAYVINLESRIIRCLTCASPISSYCRVMHLITGDYILIGGGVINSSNVWESRGFNNKLWFLSKKLGSKPVYLDQKVFEGLAVSKNSLKIAYSISGIQYPDIRDENYQKYQMFIAEIKIIDDSACIVNKKQILISNHPPTRLEPQDFFDNDTHLTFSNYHTSPDGTETCDVMVYNLNDSSVSQMTHTNCHNEPEGIFPDGVYSTIECDCHAVKRGEPSGLKYGWGIDIYKLKLDGSGNNLERLTYFNEYKGFTASNPVVSTDGRFMAFQVGHSRNYGAHTGSGKGILLYRLKK
jgi:hypothetical protein